MQEWIYRLGYTVAIVLLGSLGPTATPAPEEPKVDCTQGGRTQNAMNLCAGRAGDAADSTLYRSRMNLLIHIVAVPVFALGNILLLVGLVQLSWILAGAAIVVTVAAIGARGQGHRRERLPPEPLAGPLNALSRILCEQWVTFPRFVLSGGWASALRRTLAP